VVDLIDEAARLETFLDSHALRFCFIGGIAVQWWGEPRLTRDIDISLLTGFGAEAEPVDLLLGAYAPRIADARQFALANRVLLLRSPGGIGIDVSLAALPYEELAIGRAALVELMPGRQLRLCSAEDLIVMKLFAGRETDVRDARSVAVRQAARLDWGYVGTQLAEFADLSADPDVMTRLQRLRGAVPPAGAPSTCR
jgi:hypothetical protein